MLLLGTAISLRQAIRATAAERKATTLLESEQAAVRRAEDQSLNLRHNLARQLLQRGQALCEQGEMTRGLHWMARSLEQAPGQNVRLKEVFARIFANWVQQWNPPRAVFLAPNPIQVAVISSDGCQVATIQEFTKEVLLWATDQESPRTLAGKPSGTIRQLMFCPTGRLLLTVEAIRRYGCGKSGLASHAEYADGAEFCCETIAFSPDESFAVQRRFRRSPTGMGRHVLPTCRYARGTSWRRISLVLSPDGKQLASGGQ